jgi:uncharacterized protein involved in outer membrane biogenesis
VNSFLLGLAALAIVVLTALFAAPLFIDWNEYRPVFEAQASKLLGRDVKVDGKVHLVLLPSPELRFDDVKVADETGSLERPFLEARSIGAWLNISSLLSGAVEARKMTIVDPVLRLDLKEDGTGNWRDVGRPGVALPFAPKEVMLDSVSISGGRLEISKHGKPQLVLEGIEGDASAQSLSGPYKAALAYDYDGRRQELRFSTNQADADGLFRLKAALRDPEVNATYQLDGVVVGVGAEPSFDGDAILRVTKPSPVIQGDATALPAEQINGEPPQPTSVPADPGSFVELKGPLSATPNRVELPEFELTVHAQGRPQLLKGKLALDLAAAPKASAELSGRFVDLDALFGVASAEERLPPAAVLYMFADTLLNESAKYGEISLVASLEQAGLGGDLLGGFELALVTNDAGVKIERLKATIPGKNQIEVQGKLSHGEFGPVFAGPIKLEGAGLKTLTRWAAGDRDVTGQASTGDFALAANATVGDGVVKLADVQGELSGTKFGGSLNYKGGERNLIEVNLDSDRLDLREMIGEGPIWRAWLPAANGKGQAADGSAPNVLTQVRDDDLRVTVEVEELLLPNVPPGRLDARFTLVDDVLDVQKLDLAAADELKLTGSGRIEQVSDRPTGRVGFAFRAATTDSLRIASALAGLPEDVSKSKYLSSLAPLDIEVGFAATREGDATKAVLELGGNAAGSDLALTARAVGEPTRLGEASIDLDGSVTGERPQALLVLLFPNLPADRFAAPSGSQGELSVKLSGVPNVNMTGNLALETKAMTLAFDGQGSFQESGLALQGRGSIATQDTSLALMMAGLEAPPSAANVPLSLSADVVKEGGNIAVDRIAGTVAGEAVAGTAHFDTSGEKTRFTLHADAGAVSLPSLLGVLVGWQRAPSTEDGLGAVGVGASEVWPSRGFALGAIENAEGELKLNAKTLSLGHAFPLSGATLAAQVTKEGLTVTDLRGGLFGGTFGASGSLSPRGAGAEFEAIAELKGGKLEEVSAGLVGKGLAKGPFELTFTAQGEGLSPPGLVAGLSGQGTLALGPGSVHPLSAEPLRQFAATTARKTSKVGKEQIAADARAVGEKLTSGVYKYPASKLAFDMKNGTLRLQPATLQGSGVETKINAYVELASLKLDSEWAMSLTGAPNKAIPPVGLVFTGALDKAGEIAPAVDTAAIESYLTLRRLQEDVEKLETLDVSGRTPPQEEPTAETPAEPMRAEDAPAEPAPSQGVARGQALPALGEPPREPGPPQEATPVAPPAPSIARGTAHVPALQSAPQAHVDVPATEAMQMPVPNAAPEPLREIETETAAKTPSEPLPRPEALPEVSGSESPEAPSLEVAPEAVPDAEPPSAAAEPHPAPEHPEQTEPQPAAAEPADQQPAAAEPIEQAEPHPAAERFAPNDPAAAAVEQTGPQLPATDQTDPLLAADPFQQTEAQPAGTDALEQTDRTEPQPSPKPRRASRVKREKRDAWKKGIPFLGGY